GDDERGEREQLREAAEVVDPLADAQAEYRYHHHHRDERDPDEQLEALRARERRRARTDGIGERARYRQAGRGEQHQRVHPEIPGGEESPELAESDLGPLIETAL